ncbi:palmitoyltransferase akr1 [Maudiozyma exigua]|uniref:Palmitoyltransferase n=1 Tax=Maudiozyma exigua TaxID=34358 RepID=A0A9P6W693_MAUEX|nr:palmitoyltransferase akr1 [Kazachstania exigua]
MGDDRGSVHEPEVQEDMIGDTSSLQAVVSHESAETNADNSKKDDMNPVLGEYQQACQSGDLVTVKRLIESGVIDVNEDYDPAEKVSGLHWAAINNRLAVVKYLISQGVDVNCQAEKLHSTPLHWAARYGYVYIVDYLIAFGADMNLKDDQGFNLLHLSVNSSNIMLVAYVLFFVVAKGLLDINTQDPNGRTALLWASYQGDSLTVALLLKFGANINLQDAGGFTALHWGVVKGQVHVIKYLIRAGGDFFQKTNDQKDCFTIANELNTMFPLKKALRSCGFIDTGYPVFKLFSEPFHAKFITFIIPLLFIGFAANMFCVSHILIWFIVLLIIGFALNEFFQRWVIPSFIGPTNVNDPLIDYNVSRSPLMAGIFFGSLFWVTIAATIMIMPNMWRADTFKSCIPLLIFISASYFTFVKLLRSDPGVKPAIRDDVDKIRDIITDLMSIGKFDTENFCIETWVRKPMRSKYSKFSRGLVSRFDHFCPWVYNDIGLKNHKLFMNFIISVECGIIAFAYLTIHNFELIKNKISVDQDKIVECSIIGGNALCYGYHYDKFTFIILLWSLLQGSWILFLLLMQSFQVAKGVTSYEFTQYARAAKKAHGILGSAHHHHGHDTNITNEIENGHVLSESFNTTPDDMKVQEENETIEEIDFTVEQEQLLEDDLENSVNRIQVNNRGKSIIGLCYKLLGFTQVWKLMRETLGFDPNGSGFDSLNLSKRLQIPTNYGVKQNMKDFWLTSAVGAPLWLRFLQSPRDSHALLNGIDVEYFSLYELPAKVRGSTVPIRH